jgi:hypothetical protein
MFRSAKKPIDSMICLDPQKKLIDSNCKLKTRNNLPHIMVVLARVYFGIWHYPLTKLCHLRTARRRMPGQVYVSNGICVRMKISIYMA